MACYRDIIHVLNLLILQIPGGTTRVIAVNTFALPMAQRLCGRFLNANPTIASASVCCKCLDFVCLSLSH